MIGYVLFLALTGTCLNLHSDLCRSSCFTRATHTEPHSHKFSLPRSVLFHFTNLTFLSLLAPLAVVMPETQGSNLLRPEPTEYMTSNQPRSSFQIENHKVVPRACAGQPLGDRAHVTVFRISVHWLAIL